MPLDRNLRNTYFVMRHGRSQANEQSLIVSSPNSGLQQFGLTEAGIEEVRNAIRLNRKDLMAVTKIYASDFLRARQTAELVAQSLEIEVEFTASLRERGFGDWEGKSNQNYETVWQADALSSTHQKWNVESVQSVADRMVAFLNQVDQSSSGQTFLLVSHGDPLQILLTHIAGNDLRTHRQLIPLGTGELRRLESARNQESGCRPGETWQFAAGEDA